MIRIDEEETTALTPTSLSKQGYREEDLREWILENPDSILGEDILIIGREVEVQEIGDGIDLLGIDRDGNVVVIELKRGPLPDSVDFQSLKYSAYASYWDWGQISDQFEKFVRSQWGQELYDEGVDFNEKLESFCNDEYELNEDQRILLVGEDIGERLELVVRWLSDKDVEISVLEVEVLADGDQLYLDTEQTIPTPEYTVSGVKIDTSEDPWKEDGKRWHLKEKLNEDAAELLREVVDALENLKFLNGPHWEQKQYVSFKQNRKNRVTLKTRTEVFKVKILDVTAEDIDVEALADAIGVSVEDVKADSGDLEDGRPRTQITCRGGTEIDTERLADEVRGLLEEK